MAKTALFVSLCMSLALLLVKLTLLPAIPMLLVIAPPFLLLVIGAIIVIYAVYLVFTWGPQ